MPQTSSNNHYVKSKSAILFYSGEVVGWALFDEITPEHKDRKPLREEGEVGNSTFSPPSKKS